MTATRSRAIVLVLNNECYGMLEALDGERSYFNRRSWDFVAHAKSLGCDGRRAETPRQLHAAIVEAEQADAAFLIEVRLDSHDLSPIMQRIHDYVPTAGPG